MGVSNGYGFGSNKLYKLQRVSVCTVWGQRENHDIGYILKNKLYSNTEDFKTSKLEFSTLQNSSNPLRSYK